MNRSRKAVFTKHLTGEAALLPLEEDGDAEGLSEFTTVIRCHFPVKEAWSATIYLLVPEFYFLFGNAVVKEIEKTGRGVLSSGEGNDVFVVVEKIEIHGYFFSLCFRIRGL